MIFPSILEFLKQEAILIVPSLAVVILGVVLGFFAFRSQKIARATAIRSKCIVFAVACLLLGSIGLYRGLGALASVVQWRAASQRISGLSVAIPNLFSMGTDFRSSLLVMKSCLMCTCRLSEEAAELLLSMLLFRILGPSLLARQRLENTVVHHFMTGSKSMLIRCLMKHKATATEWIPTEP